MYHDPNGPRLRSAHVPHTACPIASLFAASGEGLANAAGLLAGKDGARLVSRLQEAISRGATEARSTRRDLFDLLDILALENVDDGTRPEAAYFAGIDPADPVVEEICLLTDQLREALVMADLERPPASRLRPAA
ncbi:MAG: hypothetical protein ACU0FH_20470 [Heliomarina sp.]|uniref:hypothetical protein n=1 Tax=Heliomarina sp. TaxID=2917556 RepID=UPI004058AB33